jgi:uncharacterized phage protein (TIGR01671 family)
VEREIEFRGKATESHETSIDGIEVGDWLTGFYYYCGERITAIIIINLGAECGGVGSGLVQVHVAVDYNTVGQYTGKKDKSGKKIFEGDIFEHDDGMVKVVWNKKLTGFDCEFKDGEIIPLWEIVDGFGGSNIIVGNIHDNADLVNAEGD